MGIKSAWKALFTPEQNAVLENIHPLQYHTGGQLINAWSKMDEPKIVDYPKGQYKAYWEIFLNPISGGYTALVKFHGYRNHEDIEEEHQFTEPMLVVLKEKVNHLIRAKMESFKR